MRKTQSQAQDLSDASEYNLMLPPSHILETYSSGYLTAKPLFHALLSATPRESVAATLTRKNAAEQVWEFAYVLYQDQVMTNPDQWWEALLVHLPWKMELRGERAANRIPISNIIATSRASGLAKSSYGVRSPYKCDHVSLIEVLLSEEAVDSRDFAKIVSLDILDRVRQNPKALQTWISALESPQRWEKHKVPKTNGSVPVDMPSDDEIGNCAQYEKTLVPVRHIMQEMLAPPMGKGFQWIEQEDIRFMLTHERKGASATEEYPYGHAHHFVLWALEWYPNLMKDHHGSLLKGLLMHTDRNVRIKAIHVIGHYDAERATGEHRDAHAAHSNTKSVLRR